MQGLWSYPSPSLWGIALIYYLFDSSRTDKKKKAEYENDWNRKKENFIKEYETYSITFLTDKLRKTKYERDMTITKLPTYGVGKQELRRQILNNIDLRYVPLIQAIEELLENKRKRYQQINHSLQASESHEGCKVFHQELIRSEIRKYVKKYGYPFLDGETIGFSEFTVVIRRPDWDISIRIETPHGSLRTFDYLLVPDTGDSSMKEEHHEEGSYHLAVLKTLNEVMETFKSNNFEVINGADFGRHTHHDLYIRFERCDIQVSISALKEDQHRFGPLIGAEIS